MLAQRLFYKLLTFLTVIKYTLNKTRKNVAKKDKMTNLCR